MEGGHAIPSLPWPWPGLFPGHGIALTCLRTLTPCAYYATLLGPSGRFLTPGGQEINFRDVAANTPPTPKFGDARKTVAVNWDVYDAVFDSEDLSMKPYAQVHKNMDCWTVNPSVGSKTRPAVWDAKLIGDSQR